MFCRNCGRESADGTRFCPGCGEPLHAVSTPAQPPHHPPAPPTAPPPATAGHATGGGTAEKGFFRSPAGIAVIVIAALLVVGGAVTGTVLLVRGGSGSSFEDDIARAWEEYEEIVDEADAAVGTDIASAAMLATYKAELERNRKKVEALEDVVKKLSPPDDYWKGKYEQLSGSIGYYDRYVRRLIDLYSSLAAGAAETRPGSISAILEDLERLAIRVKELANEFLEDNRAVTAGEFDPGVLDLPGEIAAEVEGAVDGRTADGSETGQSEETAIAGARAVLEKALAAYRDGGWEAVTPYMSPELLRAYNSAPVPWDQVSYTITGTDIQSETLTGADSATFGVLETLDELGEIYTESVEWQMLKSGGAWKVHNTIDGYGESKL